MQFTQERSRDKDRHESTNIDINELRNRRASNKKLAQQSNDDVRMDVEELETEIAAPLIGTLSPEDTNQASESLVVDNGRDILKLRPKREDSDIAKVFKRRARVRRIGDTVRAIGTIVSAILVIYLFWIWIVPIFWD